MSWNKFNWAQMNPNEIEKAWMSLNKSKSVQMSLNKPKWAWSSSTWGVEALFATFAP